MRQAPTVQTSATAHMLEAEQQVGIRIKRVQTGTILLPGKGTTQPPGTGQSQRGETLPSVLKEELQAARQEALPAVRTGATLSRGLLQ